MAGACIIPSALQGWVATAKKIGVGAEHETVNASPLAAELEEGVDIMSPPCQQSLNGQTKQTAVESRATQVYSMSLTRDMTNVLRPAAYQLICWAHPQESALRQSHKLLGLYECLGGDK